MVRRAQERAHSLKTWFPFVDSPMPSTKHCSAFSGFKREQIEAIDVLGKDALKVCNRGVLASVVSVAARTTAFRALKISRCANQAALYFWGGGI